MCHTTARAARQRSNAPLADATSGGHLLQLGGNSRLDRVFKKMTTALALTGVLQGLLVLRECRHRVHGHGPHARCGPESGCSAGGAGQHGVVSSGTGTVRFLSFGGVCEAPASICGAATLQLPCPAGIPVHAGSCNPAPPSLAGPAKPACGEVPPQLRLPAEPKAFVLRGPAAATESERVAKTALRLPRWLRGRKARQARKRRGPCPCSGSLRVFASRTFGTAATGHRRWR